ncbi:hypothetical protein FDI40_gp166 [Agrobacterium phage Atu_ph07]|uniref:Uncharacterized protein n=1 Tax=Agrobacterium phage Atu_ph07 TaxID=2024264 RepID=A0A2L0UZJ4_9CAUD|nr:hypothetical protein FDI40_gp166 [Agrobacterium phage Atu_ph07]AUZ94948.1 hypothetical protein [Agrobacterium phage Atu_ph07]
MTQISAMFDCGLNMSERLDWEFLDTPPAKAWQAAITRFDMEISNPVDTYFCDCDSDAERIWNNIRGQLHNLNITHKALGTNYKKITPAVINAVLSHVMNTFTSAPIADMNLLPLIEELKHIGFWIHNGKDKKVRSNESVFGTIRFNHKTIVEFEESWIDYITHDIQYGHIYATPMYEKRPYSFLSDSNIDDIKTAIVKDEFGLPSFLSAGFEIPFFDEHTAIHGRVVENLIKYKKEIDYLNPKFRYDHAIKTIGLIPVGRLINSNANKRIAFTSSSDAVKGLLGSIKNAKILKKIETYED